MLREFPEADWKVFRDLRTVALERFCDRTIAEVNRLSSDLTKTAHDRYIEMYKFIERRDRELARAFDAPRRSQAMSQLALISSLGLLTPEELSRFTPATRDSVVAVAEIFQQPRRRGRK